MSDFKHLTPENINMFAIKHYDNPSCVDEQEFLDDMKRFKYLKRLFRKFDTTKELKSRLIINHIIVLANVFGIDAATTLLFFRYSPCCKADNINKFADEPELTNTE